jgi:hypothetical protein
LREGAARWTKIEALNSQCPKAKSFISARLEEARISCFGISQIVEGGDFDSTISRGNIRREISPLPLPLKKRRRRRRRTK